MIKKLDWSPKNDNFLKEKEVEIHNEYHKKLADGGIKKSEIFGSHRRFRIKALKKAISKTGIQLNGNILEIGAGDGWCSAYMHTNYKINHIYTMEINNSATDLLIPKVFEITNVDTTKATTVLGSFNNIELKNHFDFVVAMGAIHHSQNLFQTFKNIYDSLKPGGWFLAQEPYMKNNTINDFYFKREVEEVNFKNFKKIKNHERTDIFYRECEYRTAGFHAGFDYNSETVFKTPQSRLDKFLGKKQKEVEGKPNNLIIYAQKPKTNVGEKTPTGWEGN